jgi:hypothetical protein
MNVVGNGNGRLFYGANDLSMMNCVFKDNSISDGFNQNRISSN